MSYATLDELKQRLGTDIYGQLTDRVNGEVADDDVGNAILDGAHGTINGFVARRFLVPVDVSTDTSLAQFLRKHTLNVAEYDAWAEWPFRSEINERVKFNYQETIRVFRDIAAGKAELPGAAAIPSANVTGPSAIAIGEARIFTKDSMKGL